MVLDNIKDIVSVINQIEREYNELKDVESNLKVYHEIYKDILLEIKKSINYFNVLDDEILDHHSLSLSNVKILKFKLDCILQDILDIKSQVDIIVNKKCCTISNLCGMSKFTILQEKLDGAFKEILVILQNLNQLVDNVLGQSIRILNEDFKYGWLLSGKNQLNNSRINEDIFKENLFLYYKKQLKETNKKIDVDSTNIQKYISINISVITEYIDTCNITGDNKRDNKISILELNKVHDLLELDTVKGIQGIANKIYIINEKVPCDITTNYQKYMKEKIETNIEENKVDIKVNKDLDDFKQVSRKKVEFEFNDIENKKLLGNSRPAAINYGSDFPCCLIEELKIDKSDVEEDNLFFIFHAEDQGWGGTGHINVRYTLNGEDSKVAFFIDRNKIQEEIFNSEIDNINKDENINNLYLVSIPKEELDRGENVFKFYLYCPPWNGSIGKVLGIRSNIQI